MKREEIKTEHIVKTKGIRARGNVTGNKPIYHCSNCNCYRYNPCTCMKRAK